MIAMTTSPKSAFGTRTIAALRRRLAEDPVLLAMSILVAALAAVLCLAMIAEVFALFGVDDWGYFLGDAGRQVGGAGVAGAAGAAAAGGAGYTPYGRVGDVSRPAGAGAPPDEGRMARDRSADDVGDITPPFEAWYRERGVETRESSWPIRIGQTIEKWSNDTFGRDEVATVPAGGKA